jgi:hypothetical protein
MRYEYVPAVIGQELCLPLKETVRKVDGGEEFGKPTCSALDGGVDRHPGTVWIGRTRVRVKDDEDVPGPNSKFQAGDDFRRTRDDGDR